MADFGLFVKHRSWVQIPESAFFPLHLPTFAARFTGGVPALAMSPSSPAPRKVRPVPGAEIVGSLDALTILSTAGVSGAVSGSPIKVCRPAGRLAT